MAGQQLPDDLFAWLRDLDRRLVALERSPQLTSASIKDGALTIYNSAGQPIVVLGKQANGRYGLRTYDAAGVLRAALGELDDGTYDLAGYDAAGANAVKLSTLAFGQGFDYIATGEATTSTVDADLATVGPTVTVTVGASGRVLAMFSAITTVSATGASASFGISVDGAAVAAASGFVHNFGAGSGGSGAAAVRQITGLTPGSHTFRLKYKSTNGTSVSFSNRSLLVLPF